MTMNYEPIILFISCTALIFAGNSSAQTFTTLHNFSSRNTQPGYANYAEMVISSGTLYGTTDLGGVYGNGMIYSLNVDGTAFTNVYSFSTLNNHTNNDGAGPLAGVVVFSNMLYGTTGGGGTNGSGAIFAISTNGTSLKTLYCFSLTQGSSLSNNDGYLPVGGLLLSGNTLYGTTFYGGTNGNGVIFSIRTDGTEFVDLYSFTAGVINNDGGGPEGVLTKSGSTLYGTTSEGGTNGNGTIFTIKIDGTGFTNLHNFGTTSARAGSGVVTNNDGANPSGRLTLFGDTLYGTAWEGGTNGNGTVFALNTNGTGFTVLHTFSGRSPTTNSDGGDPGGDVILFGSTLYGAASQGGQNGNGTLFSLATNGTGFVTLHNFSAGSTTNSEGIDAFAGLIISGNTLYGDTTSGGTNGFGTVFSFSLPPPPQLEINYSGTNVILTWPSNSVGLILQATTNLSPAVWSAAFPAPAVVEGQNTVTNPILNASMFYRLSQ